MKNAIKDFIHETDMVFLGLCFTCSAISVYSIFAIGATMKSVDSLKPAVVQLAATIIGIALAVIISTIDYRELCQQYKVHSALTYGLMILTAFIGFAPPGTTNKAWIQLPFGLTIQPSELLKISMILTLALVLDKYKNNIDEIRIIIKLAGIAFIPFAFVAFQRDGGTMLVYLFIIACMFFAAGISYKLVAMGFAALIIGSPIIWFFGMEPYQKNRILGLFKPEEFKSIMVQQNSGKISIGSGKIFGKGFFVDNHNAVPLPQNDFIFSFIAESVGFIGIMVVLVLILTLSFRILSIAKNANDGKGAYICVGIFAMIITQTIINVGMNLSVLPVIGITLPLFSAGGTSVVTTYCAIGLVLSVARYNKKNLFF